MIISSHVALGVAVASATQNPLLGFVAGFISHHIADAIPHTDPGSTGASVDNIFKDKKALMFVAWDIVLALIIFSIGIYYLGFSLVILLSTIGATLPDVIDNSPFWSPNLRKVFPMNYYHLFHEKFHFTIMNIKYLWVGYVIQAVLITACMFIVIK